MLPPLARINSRHPMFNFRHPARLAGGNPLGYRHRQLCPKALNNFRQHDEKHRFKFTKLTKRPNHRKR